MARGTHREDKERTKEMKTIRWGIIGVGDVTEVKSGPGFSKAENSELVAVMRRNRDLAADYARRHNVPRWYTDADALIHDSEVDAVYIATPPHVHMAYTLMAAAAGKPVYCEKPMALTAAECEQMVAACRQADVPLWVAYYRRTLDKFVRIKAMLDENAIGPVQMVTSQLHLPSLEPQATVIPWRLQPEIGGGGRFVDMGSHMLDILDYFFGPLENVDGHAVNTDDRYTAEDNVVASFTLANGAIGSGVWRFTGATTCDQTTLFGGNGTITFSCFDDRPATITRDGALEYIGAPFPEHVQQPMIQSIVDELNGRGACPSDGLSALRTTRAIDQILSSYREAA